MWAMDAGVVRTIAPVIANSLFLLSMDKGIWADIWVTLYCSFVCNIRPDYPKSAGKGPIDLQETGPKIIFYM